MKGRIIAFIAFVLSCPVVSFAGVTAEEIINNINEQASHPFEVEVVMEIVSIEGGVREVIEEKKLFLETGIKDGKEAIKGEILEPERESGTISLSWEGSKVKIDHQQKRRGKTRPISTSLRNPFLGSSFSYVDIRFLEDTTSYKHVMLGIGSIGAESSDTKKTVYEKKVLLVKLMPKEDESDEDFWVIERVMYFNERGKLLKTRVNKEFERFSSGWRPNQILMTREGSSYGTLLKLEWKEVAE